MMGIATSRNLLRDRRPLLGLLIILSAGLVGCASWRRCSPPIPRRCRDFNPPSGSSRRRRTYLLGTDRMGADIYSRLLFGARITLTIAVVAVGVAVLIGVPIGLVAGYTDGIGSATC